jgi:predicted CoA-substrate-specific enzyme activase
MESCFVGIDVGSLTSKAVLIDGEGIVARCVMPTGALPQQAGRTALEKVLESAGKMRDGVDFAVGTGYGGVNLPFVNRTVTELTCHAKGVHYLNPRIRTVIDIGGQDSKAIRLDDAGNMVDFAMNDRCAAGTGRFLEVMAHALEVSLESIGRYALRSASPCAISNTCAVFAESEVIGLLAAGCSKQDIAGVLHAGVAKRVGNMARRLGIVPELAFVGGVAKNAGARKALESFLGMPFAPLDENPQITGALGAAVLARDLFTASEG